MTQHAHGGRITALFCLLAVMVSWGIIPILLRYFIAYLDPWTVNGIRYLIGALIWLPFVLIYSRRAKAHSTPHRSVWIAALIPTAINIVGQTGYALSPYYVGASVIGFALRMSFLFTLVLGLIFIAEERQLAHKPTFWGGATLCLCGIGLMFLGSLHHNSHSSVIGLIILLGTTVVWGGYAVSVRKFMAPYPVRLSFGVISIYTSAALVAFIVLAPDIPPHPLTDLTPATGPLWRLEALGRLSPILWTLLIASAIFGIALGHVLYYRGIHRLGPVVASGITLASPLITYAVAALILNERLGSLQLAGGLAVVCGGLLLLIAKTQVEKGPTPIGADRPTQQSRATQTA